MQPPTNHLKQKLRQSAVTLGLWVTLESPTITEIAATLGLDWVCIDAEHGHLDFKEIVEHVRAARNTHTTPLVRIQEIEQGLIKRVLDIGAEGIVVPQVTCAAEVEQAVRFAKYPPRGLRGVGGERATSWGLGLKAYTRSADQETLVIPLIETVAAARDIDNILKVPGVDAIFLGPADFSASSGYLGEWEGPGVAEQLLLIKDKARAAGLACGVMATDVKNAVMRREQGFRMIALGADTGLLIRATVEAMTALGVSATV
jgi:2-dehydro-3-deoxyglucarate aldolase/4-hydroxy-2-oxoheptanedioate aldolase